MPRSVAAGTSTASVPTLPIAITLHFSSPAIIVLVMGDDVAKVRAARKAVEEIALELQRDGLYQGKVTQCKEFGVFVRIANHEGLVHVSELAGRGSLETYRSGDSILVRVLGADQKGRLKLSQRAAEGAAESEALNV